MPDSVISQLPAIGLLDQNALLPAVQAGVTSQVKASQIASLLAQMSGQPLVSVATGTGDALVASFTPQVSALVNGANFLVRAPGASTLAAPTLKLGTTPAKPIVKGSNVPLQKGDVSGASHWLEVVYDSGLDAFVLANPVYPAVAAADLLVSSVNGGQLAGFRNVLINGDMRICQRSMPAGGGYGLDRWFVNNAGTQIQVTQFGPAANFPGEAASYALNVAGAAGNTGHNVTQRIEAANSRHLAGKTVILSYWHYNNTGVVQNVGTGMSYASSLDNFGAITAIPGTTGTTVCQPATWTFITSIFNVPAAAVNGLMVILGNGYGGLGAGQNVAYANAQLELGSVATPFERRPYGVELTLCQRYYETGTIECLGSSTAALQYIGSTYQYKATKRIQPTVTLTGTYFSNTNTLTTVQNKQDMFSYYVISTAGALCEMTGTFTSNAEL